MKRKIPSFIQTGIVVNVGSACVIPRLRRIRRKGVVGERSDSMTASVSEPLTTTYLLVSLLVRSTSTGSSSHIQHHQFVSLAYTLNRISASLLYIIALARSVVDDTNRYGRNRLLFASFSRSTTCLQANWDVVPFMVRRTKCLLLQVWLALSRCVGIFSLLLRKQSHCSSMWLYILHTIKLLPKSFKTLSYMFLYMSYMSLLYIEIVSCMLCVVSHVLCHYSIAHVMSSHCSSITYVMSF